MVGKNLKFIFSSLALNLKKEAKYKSSFFIQIFAMVLNDALFIVQWVIIFSFIDDIAGFGFNEVMLLWAMSAGGFGVARVFFGGAWKIKDIVYEGRLDVYLTQPKNVLINVCCSSTDVSAIGDMLYAFVVLFIIGAPWYWFLLLVPVIVVIGLLYTAIYVTYVSLCFRVPSGDALGNFVDSSLLKLNQYPPQIFSFGVKLVLLTVIPAIFFTFIPAQYVFLTPNFWWILGLVAVAIVWVCLAFISFNSGLKRYNSGSLMGGRM